MSEIEAGTIAIQERMGGAVQSEALFPVPSCVIEARICRYHENRHSWIVFVPADIDLGSVVADWHEYPENFL
jgi:hypothetical protein